MNHRVGISAKAIHVQASMTPGVRENTFCKYSHRDCTQNCLEGYDYCLRHILEEKTAPYRPCAYVTKAGRKCTAAAPKLDKKECFCASHTKKALLMRQRFTRKRRPKETSDTLLEDLVATTSSLDSNHSVEHRRGKIHSDSVAAKSLEYASSSDSDTESMQVEHAWRDSGDSDADSIDSDQEDILKYAGVYTTEEVAQILRDKLIRLQALYIDQFKRLKHILLTKRKQFLEEQKFENRLCGSIKRYKQDPQQRELYDKLCAMKRYHKKFGMENLMQQQSIQRRLKITEGMADKLSTPIKCTFTDEGLGCTQPVVPLSKFCQKHILHDQHQVLYQPCPFADSQCGRPVATLLGSPFCSLHQALPPTVTNASLDDDTDVKEEENCGQEMKPFDQQNVDKQDGRLIEVKSETDEICPEYAIESRDRKFEPVKDEFPITIKSETDEIEMQVDELMPSVSGKEIDHVADVVGDFYEDEVHGLR